MQEARCHPAVPTSVTGCGDQGSRGTGTAAGSRGTRGRRQRLAAQPGAQPRHRRACWLLTASFTHQTALLLAAEIWDNTLVQTAFFFLFLISANNSHQAPLPVH